MVIQKTTDGSKMTISVSGRLDTTTAPEFEAELKESLGSITDLTIDFSALDYISSAGLRVLLSAQKVMNNQKGTMRVTGSNDVIREIFEVTGFSDILTIE